MKENGWIQQFKLYPRVPSEESDIRVPDMKETKETCGNIQDKELEGMLLIFNLLFNQKNR